MCTACNEKNKNIKNLIFTNLWWHFGLKKVQGKYTDIITGEVKTKTACISIQKLVETPTITTNNYKKVEADKLVDYGSYRQPGKLNSGASGYYYGKNTGVRNRQKKHYGIKVQVAAGKKYQ